MKNLDHLFILICIYLARIIIFGSSFAEALVFVACISYILLNKYLSQQEVAKYNGTIDEKINKLEEDVKKVSASAGAIAIGNSYSSNKR